MKFSRKVVVVGGAGAARALRGSGFKDVANLRGGFLQARLNSFDSCPSQAENPQPSARP